MKIERLSEFSIKIALTEDDLFEYGISYDGWDSKNTSEFLLSISDEIMKRVNTDITTEKLYVEIFSRKSSCLIFVSFAPRRREKKSRCKVVCTFTDFQSLKSFCGRISLKIHSSSLYYSNCALKLLLELPSEQLKLLELCGDECLAEELDSVRSASISEYYVCAQKENAIERINEMSDYS